MIDVLFPLLLYCSLDGVGKASATKTVFVAILCVRRRDPKRRLKRVRRASDLCLHLGPLIISL